MDAMDINKLNVTAVRLSGSLLCIQSIILQVVLFALLKNKSLTDTKHFESNR